MWSRRRARWCVRNLAARGYPGIAVAVSVDGKTIWSEGFGYADLEHRVPMWPSVKFPRRQHLEVADRGGGGEARGGRRLDLDVADSAVRPVFPGEGASDHDTPARRPPGGIRHYQGDENFIRDPYPTVLDGLSIFADDPLLHEPGTAFAYTSYGFNLLSAVVEAREEAVSRHHARGRLPPAGPARHRRRLRDPDHPGADQLLRARRRRPRGERPVGEQQLQVGRRRVPLDDEDVLAFANAHLDDGYLSEASRKLLFTEQRTRDGNGVGYGFGWFIRERDDGRRLLSHSGGSVGGTSLMVMEPESRVVVVGREST